MQNKVDHLLKSLLKKDMLESLKIMMDDSFYILELHEFSYSKNKDYLFVLQ